MKMIGILLGAIKKIKAAISRSSDRKKVPEKSNGLEKKQKPIKKEAVEKDHANKPEDDTEDLSILNVEEKDSQLAEGVIITEDKDEPDEESSGDESNEGIDKEPENSVEGIETQDQNVEVSPSINNLFKRAGFTAKKRYAVGGAVAGIIILVALNSTKFMNRPSSVKQKQLAPVQIYLASIEGKTNTTFYFDRFLILLINEEQAYISIDVAVTPSSKSVFGEIKAKRTICRSIIYSILKEALTKKYGRIESWEKLQEDILKALNSVLVTGTVEGVDLSEVFSV